MRKWRVDKPIFFDEKDARYEEEVKQISERGFGDSETWNLYIHIAEFTLPRLRHFLEIGVGHPTSLTLALWNKKLRQMIVAFEIIVNDNPKELARKRKQITKGLGEFGKYFESLWW